MLASRTAREQFKHLRYDDLIGWLIECRQRCRADRLRPFLDDFIGYIRREFMGIQHMTETEHIVDHVWANPDSYTAMIEIGLAVPEVKRRLTETLRKDLEERCEQAGYAVPELYLDWKSKWTGIYIRFNKGDVYKAAFQFEGHGCWGLRIGICKHDPKLPDHPAVREAMVAAFGEAGSEAWYVWKRRVAENDDLVDIPTDWNTNAAAWRGLQDGTIADRIMKVVAEIRTALDRAGVLETLGPPA